MNKFDLWREFLAKQERIAGDMFIIAGLGVLFWWLLVRGRRWEKWANAGAVAGFLLASLALLVWGG